MNRLAATLLALAATALPAAAQDDFLTASAVRTFLGDLAPEAETAVAEGDWQGIRGWIETHVADDANIALTGTFVATDGPTMTYQAAMTGRDLKRASALSISAMGPQTMANGAIGSYEADAEVHAVTELPDGMVAAEVTFTEYGRLDLAALARSAAASEDPVVAAAAGIAQDEAPPPAVFMSRADCTFRLARREGEIVIVLAACETGTTM